ncbi:MAG: histidine kinase dimerization/phospho-acceptor domain-containing protein [Xanthobacteraceae bacterium]
MLRHPRLASLATAERPAWLWSADGSRILWANAVGAAIFGAETSSACAKRRFSVSELPAAQVLRLAATLPSGGHERLERLRGFGGNLGRALTCNCSRIVGTDGRGAVLIVAAEAAGPVLTVAERARRLLDQDGEAAAVFTPDGRLIGANAKAQGWLGEGTLTALGLEALAAAALQSGNAKTAATVNGETREITVAALGQGASSVVLVAVQSAARQIDPVPASVELQPGPGTHDGSAGATLSAPSSSDAAPAATTAKAETAAAPERRHPLRFVWDLDADGRFTIASDEFIQLIGAPAALLGRRWSEIAAELKLDPQDRVAAAVRSRETWSGITVAWPIAAAAGSGPHSQLRLPIELSGLPVFDRDRNFRGYRGFGVCRDLAQINGLARPTLDSMSGDGAPVSATSPRDGAVIAIPDLAATAAGTDPALAPVLAPVLANVVPFRPAAPVEPKAAPGLTPIERRAFRELAQELTSRLRGTHAAAAAGAIAPDVAAAQDQSLNQDELRQVLSQALNQENGEDYGAEQHQDPDPQADEDPAAEPAATADEGTSNEAEVPSPTQTQDHSHDPDRDLSCDPSRDPSREDSEVSGDAAPAAAEPQVAQAVEPSIAPVFLDRVPLGILVYRHDGLLYANRQFLEISGYEDLAAIETAGGLGGLFAEPGAPGALTDAGGAQALAIMTRSGERLPVEGRMVTVPWSGSAAMALIVNNGRPDAVAAQPASNAIEQVAADPAHEAARMAAVKAEFVAKISHDIRNPLNAITGFAEAIMSERFGPIGNERYREYIKDLNAAAAHLASIVDDMFDLSKLESGRIDLTFASLNLNELVQQCVGIMQPQANRARIIIRSALTSGLPLVKADERALRQIVLNLLSNSIKVTGPGGQIIVSTVFSDSREAILRVRDTGVGMNDKQIAAALEPFADIKAWASAGTGGTEFGLPLTKALTEANRAKFRIKSAPEAGTLVEIAFAANRTLAA